MKLLISGVCGFAGSTLGLALLDAEPALQIFGFDNFSRAGSQVNLDPLRKRGAQVLHADARSPSDMEALPPADWIIDAAANPSVLAGVDGLTSSRQLIEHNLYGTVNLLEIAKKHRAGFILLSTSRVYSVRALSEIPLVVRDNAFQLDSAAALPYGLSIDGVTENFSTVPPLSLYGASKLASEYLVLEYGETFEFPVWINRCGVLAGAGQFGHAEQGIFSFWVNAYLRRAPLKYIGFDGTGHQARDCLHPSDLVPVLQKQMTFADSTKPRIANFGGGIKNSMSLAQLSSWCAARFGTHQIASNPTPRPYDVPWLVLNSRLARETWTWQPTTSLETILDEIARHAEANPHWLEISGVL